MHSLSVTGMRGRSRVGTRIGEELPPGRQALAHALTHLYSCAGASKLDEMADRLAAAGYKKDPSEISRYLNGKRKPPLNFVKVLHKVAVDTAGRKAVVHDEAGIAELHAAAESTLCRTCTPLRRENELLRTENEQLRAAHEAGPLPLTPTRSGSGGNRRLSSPPLPVPSEPGDRQRRPDDVSAARQVTDRAIELHSAGRVDHAIGLLQDTSAVLTPLESAASIALLRLREAQLADAVIGIHGRSHTHEDVIRIALELHEYDLLEDAGAVLRAALK